jgi:hypothetical protein
MPSKTLTARAWRTIESNPGHTKSSLTRLITGKRQDVLAAINLLCDQGYVEATPGDRAKVLTAVKPYPGSPSGEPVENQSSANGGQPVGNRADHVGAPSDSPDKDGQGRHRTTEAANDADLVSQHMAEMREKGELPLHIERKCRACRPELRTRINELITAGYGLTAILELVEPINSTLPAKSRVTIDSLHKHRKLHYNAQVPAAAIYRRTLEEKAEQAAYDEHVTSLVSAAGVWQVVMDRGFQTLVAEDTQITVEQTLQAAREMARLGQGGQDDMRWARQQAQLNRIVACFKEYVPASRQQEMIARLQGRTAAQPGGVQQLAVDADTVDDDDEIEPFGGDDEDFDDDE